MVVNNKRYRTIWLKDGDDKIVSVINQQKLPHSFEVVDLSSLDGFEKAISEMLVRGAGLIGAAAGYGMYMAALHANEKQFKTELIEAGNRLKATRPTAKNLAWAVDRQLEAIKNSSTLSEVIEITKKLAVAIADEDAESCRLIGEHGVTLIREIYRSKGSTVNILTHCNAGWLAFVDWGSATAPIYRAAEEGIPVHVFVDETRPRNQGASLTAWELGQQGIDHHLIVDNTGGHLMQHGMVDLVIVGSDRTTASGDVANKIGTYLKALAAKDNNIPFFVALPSSTFDWTIHDGVKDIEIEERSGDEVRFMTGIGDDGLTSVRICPEETKALNYGFDVTPARLVTGLITERGIAQANVEGIKKLFPEKY